MGSYRAISSAKKSRSPIKGRRKSSNSPKSTNKKLAALRLELALAEAQAQKNGAKGYQDVAMTDMNETEMVAAMCEDLEKSKLEPFPEYDEILALELLSRPAEILNMPVGPAGAIDDSVFNLPPQIATYKGRLPPGLENEIMQRYYAWIVTQKVFGGCGYETIQELVAMPIVATGPNAIPLGFQERVHENFIGLAA